VNEGKQVPVADASDHYFKAASLMLGGRWWNAGTPLVNKFADNPVSGTSYCNAADVIVDGDWYEVKFIWYLYKRAQGISLTYDSEFGDNNFGCAVKISTGVFGKDTRKHEANDQLKTPYQAAVWTGEAMSRLSDRGGGGDDDASEPTVDPAPQPSVGVPSPALASSVDQAVVFLVEGS